MSRRLERIASRIRFLISAVIQRELNDPRLGMVTILRVEPTQDLRQARVIYSVFGDEGVKSRTSHAIESAAGYIQRVIGKNLETRTTPRLVFILDDSQEKISRVESLIDRVAQEDQHGQEEEG